MPIRERIVTTSAAAEDLALKAVLFMAADPERLSRFSSVTGFDPGDARRSATQPGFMAGVLSYLMQDETALLAFAAEQQINPVSVPLAYRVIDGGEPDFPISLEALRGVSL